MYPTYPTHNYVVVPAVTSGVILRDTNASDKVSLFSSPRETPQSLYMVIYSEFTRLNGHIPGNRSRFGYDV